MRLVLPERQFLLGVGIHPLNRADLLEALTSAVRDQRFPEQLATMDWMDSWLEKLVGAQRSIHFVADEPRAPSWMRRLHLEWLMRLLRHPWRHFHRHVVGIPEFLARCAQQREVSR